VGGATAFVAALVPPLVGVTLFVAFVAALVAPLVRAPFLAMMSSMAHYIYK